MLQKTPALISVPSSFDESVRLLSFCLQSLSQQSGHVLLSMVPRQTQCLIVCIAEIKQPQYYTLQNCLYFLLPDPHSLNFSERIRITTCMWLAVWRWRSNLQRRHSKCSGKVTGCLTEIHITVDF